MQEVRGLTAFTVVILGLTVGISALGGCDDDIDLAAAWVAVEPPDGPATGLRAVDYAAGVGYLVGDAGQAWRYDGEDWRPIHSGTGIEFTGAAVRSDGAAWVCGADAAGDGRLFEHAPGDGWNEVLLQDAAFLAAVAVNETDRAIAAGSRGQVWINNGDGWTLHTDQGDYLWRAADVSADGPYLVVGADAAGDGALLWFDGVDNHFVDVGGERLEDCVLVDGDSGWVVGDEGGLFRFDSGALQSVDEEVAALRGMDLFPGSTDSGWACGLGGVLFSFDADGLAAADSPTTENVQDLVLTDDEEGWAAAETHLLHYR